MNKETFELARHLQNKLNTINTCIKGVKDSGVKIAVGSQYGMEIVLSEQDRQLLTNKVLQILETEKRTAENAFEKL